MKNRLIVYGGLCLIVAAGVWSTPSEARERRFSRDDVEKELQAAGVDVDDDQSREERIQALKDERGIDDDERAEKSDRKAAADVKIPAGTRVMVTLDETLDSAKIGKGEQFTGKLKADLVVKDSLVASTGTKVYGKIVTSTRARNAFGTSVLEFKLTELMRGNQMRAIESNLTRVESEKSGRLQANAVIEADTAVEFRIGEAGSDMDPYKTQTITGPDKKAPDRVEERRNTRRGRRDR